MTSCTLFLHDPNALRAAAFAAILLPWAQRSQFALHIAHDPEELADLPDLGSTVCIYPIGGSSLHNSNVARTIVRLSDISPTSPLIIFADEADNTEITAAIEGGLQGFIPTTMPANVALAAIQFIINGGTYHPHPLAGSRSLAPAPAVRIQNDEDHRHVALKRSEDVIAHLSLAESPRWTEPETLAAPPASETVQWPGVPTKRRHLEVLEFLAKGETNKEIARHLNLTEATIKVYVRELMKHFSAKNRMQVALKASALVRAQEVSLQPDDDPDIATPMPALAMNCR